MTRYAKRPKEQRARRGLLHRAISHCGAAITRNPVAVGGTTAFLVSLAFVSANALFYQPQMHPSAFVSTRQQAPAETQRSSAVLDHPEPSAAPREEIREAAVREEEMAIDSVPESTGSVPASGGNETVREVQMVLSDLGLYRGPVDGLSGPQTNAAIESYRRIVGLEAGTQIDAALLQQLGLDEGASPGSGGAVPAPRPGGEDARVQMVSTGGDDPAIRRVQAGLKAFGHEDIEIDGIMGERTREAIREFQSLFGLPVTGSADTELLAKMREIGLVN